MPIPSPGKTFAAICELPSGELAGVTATGTGGAEGAGAAGAEGAGGEGYREQLQPLITRNQPLTSARWANVERPELMSVLGVPLAVQQLEERNSRGRRDMQNQQATLLMLDPENGLAQEHWQGGVGEVLVYRCPAPRAGPVTVGHLTVFDMKIVSGFIADELECGQALSDDPITPDNWEAYRQRWENYAL